MTAIEELEEATAKLELDPFAEDALTRRAAAVTQIWANPSTADDLERLATVLVAGERIRQRVLVEREQLRVAMAQSSREAKLAGAYGGD